MYVYVLNVVCCVTSWVISPGTTLTITTESSEHAMVPCRDLGTALSLSLLQCGSGQATLLLKGWLSGTRCQTELEFLCMASFMWGCLLSSDVKEALPVFNPAVIEWFKKYSEVFDCLLFDRIVVMDCYKSNTVFSKYCRIWGKNVMHILD